MSDCRDNLLRATHQCMLGLLFVRCNHQSRVTNRPPPNFSVREHRSRPSVDPNPAEDPLPSSSLAQPLLLNPIPTIIEPDPVPMQCPAAPYTPPPFRRPFPMAKPLAPHMTHAYSPVKPSPLSRILMLADSPESPPLPKPDEENRAECCTSEEGR